MFVSDTRVLYQFSLKPSPKGQLPAGTDPETDTHNLENATIGNPSVLGKEISASHNQLGTMLCKVMDLGKIKEAFLALRPLVFNDVADQRVGDMLFINEFSVSQINEKDIVIETKVRA